ncbi:MAG: hypothetical protein FGM62_09815, partial [Methylobacterium sp.]|nr:hypothetical protein [Methylobacterium sp.]
MSGAGELISHGLLKLSGINPFSGKTTVQNGILTFLNRNSLYNGDATQWTADRITVTDKATLALGIGNTPDKFSAIDAQTVSRIGSASGGFLGGSFIGLDTSAGQFTQDRALTNPNGGANALGLRVLGTNTLTLTAANTYSGATFVDEGTLRAGAVNTFSANSAFEVDDPATLDLGGFSNEIGSLGGSNQSAWEGVVTTSNGPATLTTGRLGTSTGFGGKLQDGGAGRELSVVKTGGGTWKLSGTNSYRGSTTVSGGTLEIGSASTLGNGHYAADLSIASGAALKFTSRTNQTLASSITGGGALILDSAWTNTDRRISSVLTLTGDNSAHTGKTTVTSGTLALPKRGALYGGDTARWTSSHLSVGNFGTLALGVGDAGAGQFTPSDVNALVGVPVTSGIFLPGSAIGIYAASNADIHVSSNPDAYDTNLININRTTLENLLGQTGVSLLTAPPDIAGGDGKIKILDNLAWGSNRLSLTAAGDIHIDAVMRPWG